MELVIDGGNDWGRLERVFDGLRTTLNLHIRVGPSLSNDVGPKSDQAFSEMMKETVRRRNCGVVYTTPASVQQAQRTGELRLRCFPTQRRSLGHMLIRWLFNENTSFALSTPFAKFDHAK
jgi:hypothetical protein